MEEPLDILDETLKTELELLRVPSQAVNQLAIELVTVEEAILKKIRQETGKEHIATRGTRRRVLGEINRQYKEPFKKYEAKMIEEIREVAGVVFDNTGAALKSHSIKLGGNVLTQNWESMPTVAVNRIVDVEKPLIGGNLWKDEAKKLSQNAARGARSAVAQGLIAGSGNDKIQAAMKLANKTTNRHARALGRTATASAMEAARVEAFKPFDKSDIITGYEWISVLDMRTTHGCAALNGIVRKKREDFPDIPRHFMCRSVIVPRTILDDVDTSETRPFQIHDERQVKHRPVVQADGTVISGGKSTKFTVPRHKSGPNKGEIIKARRGDITLERPKPGAKRSMGDQWFEKLEGKGQGKWVENYFGKTKYKLWKDNELGFMDMVNKNTLKPLTIKQIRKRISAPGFKGINA
jgi:SPP1 gp7 family putative phage head morphogenesis protein